MTSACVEAGDTAVSFDGQDLSVARGERVLARGPIVVHADGATVPTDPATATIDRLDDAARVRFEGALAVTVTLTPRDDTVDVGVAVANESAGRVVVDEVSWDAGEVDFGPWTRIYEHGYASWSPTGVLRAGESFQPDPPALRPLTTDPAADPARRTSAAFVGLAEPDAALTLGFLDHTRFVTRIECDDDAGGVSSLRAVCPMDRLPLEAGERVESAPLRIDAARDLDAGVRALVAAVGRRMDARVGETPTGWCSWYHYFDDTEPEDVLENAEALSAWDLPVRVVQIDDGYQSAWGDWDAGPGWEPRALAGSLRADGFCPGLWLAPFAVEPDAELAAAHPEWLVTRAGEPVSAGEPHRQLYGLDTTHPGALAWLRGVVSRAVDEWGFDYLKLDFLYAGALAGDRYERVPRGEAYRRGLSAIREAADEATLVGCGAPLAPSIGLVDAMRVGPDVAPTWVGDRPSAPGAGNAVRNVLSRSLLHREWWVNDPDCLLVRPTTDLTLAERRSFAALVALTGGSVLDSDRLAEVDDVGRELFESVLPPTRGGRVVDLTADVWPEHVVHERDGGVAVARFNWADEARRLAVDPADYGADRGWDYWGGEPFSGTLTREVPAHGCLVCHLADAADDTETDASDAADDRDPNGPTPRVLGVADHLASGGDRLQWSRGSDGRALALTLDSPRPLRVVVDKGNAGVAAADAERAERIDERTVVVTVDPGESSIDFE